MVDLSDYLSDLCHGRGEILRNVRPIAVRVECPAVNVPSPIAVKIGLIVDEFVANILKYAFPEKRGGTIIAELTLRAGALLLTVSDDGVGALKA